MSLEICFLGLVGVHTVLAVIIHLSDHDRPAKKLRFANMLVQAPVFWTACYFGYKTGVF